MLFHKHEAAARSALELRSVLVLGVGLKVPGAEGGGRNRGAARRCLQVAAVPRCAVLRPRRACAFRSAPGAAPAMVSGAGVPIAVRFHGAGGSRRTGAGLCTRDRALR